MTEQDQWLRNALQLGYHRKQLATESESDEEFREELESLRTEAYDAEQRKDMDAVRVLKEKIEDLKAKHGKSTDK